MIVVPLLDLKAQYAQIRAEVLPVIEQVCASQRFILGNLLLGSIPGILLGTVFGGKAPERVLRIAIGVVLVVAGTILLVN